MKAEQKEAATLEDKARTRVQTIIGVKCSYPTLTITKKLAGAGKGPV